MQEYGYIYIRNHESYDKYNAYKLGRTDNFLDRETTYKTNEITKGNYISIFRFKKNQEKFVEKLLQAEFKNLNMHVYNYSGTEFFDRKIKDLITYYLEELKNKYNIFYEQLTKEEINNITRIKRKIKTRINIRNFINYVKNNIIPNKQQLEILDKINKYYNNYDILKLLWSCGLGKTLLSILIIKKLNFKKVVIGVPSKYLQEQFYNEIIKIYPDKNNILCIGGNLEQSTTDINLINKFIKEKENMFIITTYKSCYLLNKYEFDFKISDEAHHLVGLESNSIDNYRIFHEIKSNKTLFMTATEKVIDTKQENKYYSMDDILTFGELLDKKSVNWAIENKKITDYKICIISNTELEINQIIENLNLEIENKELFLSVFMTLKSIDQYRDLTHVLICSNEIKNANIINSYVKILLEKEIFNINKEEIYYNSLHSNSKDDNNNKIKLIKEVEKFKNSKYGIISSVYIFGEGFDLPKLNGVVFAENMYSDIRIVQTALRPNRLDFNNPNKIAYVILPYMEIQNEEKEKEAFHKVRIVISTLRNVDDSIEQKIKTLKLYNIKNNNKENKEDKEYIYNFEDDKQELNKIKLRLKHSKALYSDNEDLDEYHYVKFLNKELNILSKEEYASKLIRVKHKYYIENADEYFKNKGVWKNWYDFIGLDMSNFIQTKEEWIKYCKEKNIKSLEEYNKLTNKYNFLPKNPEDFYNEFSNISYELEFNKRRKNKLN
jgi:predicted helicase